MSSLNRDEAGGNVKYFMGLVLAAVALGQPTSGDPERGKRLFERDGCFQCHGYVGQGGRDGPRLAATSLSLQTLTRYVRRPAGAMPAFTEKVLADSELRDIYAYLKSLPLAKPAKDIPLLDQLRD